MGITGVRFSTEKHLPAAALDDLTDAVGWGRSIGRAIMQRITTYLDQQALQSVGLFAWDKNPMTGPFYEGFGFTRVDFGMRWDSPAKD